MEVVPTKVQVLELFDHTETKREGAIELIVVSIQNFKLFQFEEFPTHHVSTEHVVGYVEESQAPEACDGCW